MDPAPSSGSCNRGVIHRHALQRSHERMSEGVPQGLPDGVKTLGRTEKRNRQTGGSGWATHPHKSTVGHFLGDGERRKPCHTAACQCLAFQCLCKRIHVSHIEHGFTPADGAVDDASQKGIGIIVEIGHRPLARAAERPAIAQGSDLLGDRFRVITLDLPGFGRASNHAAPPTIAGFAEHVIADLDRRGIERCVLVGHSMGGMIAQEVACRIPHRLNKLVLYGTGPLGSMPQRFEPLEVSLDRLQQDGVAKTARRIAATWLVQGEAHPGFEVLSGIGAQADSEAARTGESLSRLTMPSLVIWGDKDRSYRWPQVEYLWSHLPEASLAVIPNASHAAHVEKPEMFRLILEDFLTG